MTSALWGAVAAGAVLLWARSVRPWPWRVADLEGRAASEGDLGSSAVRRTRHVRRRHRLHDPDRRNPVRRNPVRRNRGRRARTAELRELERDLPAAIDLLALSVSAGHSLHTAVVAVATEAHGPVAAALRTAVDGFERGGRLGEELAALPGRHGEPLRPLVTTLVATMASGAAVGPALQRLVDAERRRLRRRTEERVRRLPVLLLAPLVALVLPAFVVVTIVPVALTTADQGSFAADFPRLRPDPPGASHVPIVRPHPTRHVGP